MLTPTPILVDPEVQKSSAMEREMKMETFSNLASLF